MKVLLVSDYATQTGGIEHMTLALSASAATSNDACVYQRTCAIECQ